MFSSGFDTALKAAALAPQTPHGTGHVIILKVSLGVCTLIKQENGSCGPGRENERKGE